MDFYSLINSDEKKGKVYCGTCKHFRAEVRKQFGQILGHCPYSKMKVHKACMPKCKKHYEFSGNTGVILADNFVDKCEWGTQYGLTEEEKEKMMLRKQRKEELRRRWEDIQ